MNRWRLLSTNEKVMIGFIIMLVIGLALRWGTIWKGVKKGFEPYKQQQIENIDK